MLQASSWLDRSACSPAPWEELLSVREQFDILLSIILGHGGIIWQDSVAAFGKPDKVIPPDSWERWLLEQERNHQQLRQQTLNLPYSSEITVPWFVCILQGLFCPCTYHPTLHRKISQTSTPACSFPSQTSAVKKQVSDDHCSLNLISSGMKYFKKNSVSCMFFLASVSNNLFVTVLCYRVMGNDTLNMWNLPASTS